MTKENMPFYVCPDWSDFPDISLYMDQVIGVLERYLAPFFPREEKCITSTMINNYVKHRILPPPENKRYSQRHLSRLFMICILKRFMQLADIQLLLENLVREKGEEKTYLLFKEELERAFATVYHGTILQENKQASPGEKALRSACVAFAAILLARDVFLAASFPPISAEESGMEKADKDEKKKEKKEKKEAKQKEKKDSKEKKE